jgi:hypothetical protein
MEGPSSSCQWKILYVCVLLFPPTAYGMQALTARTFVDEVFGGTLVSTVKCADCASVSDDLSSVSVLMVSHGCTG